MAIERFTNNSAVQLAHENGQFLEHLETLSINELIDEVLIEHGLALMARHDRNCDPRIINHQEQMSQWAERELRRRFIPNNKH